ncbi:hypothetical protein [uncultured Roseibium sp.]|uniref:hypothetical protein n=1 Tax=uncultured Roseibium sp. TaxID=1936171 RepID=UPI00321768AD
MFEAVRELRPLGVGINIQPNAVRELYDLGIGPDEMDKVGLPAKEWALVGLNGNDIYSENARPARRLQLAAICGASRPLPHAAREHIHGPRRRGTPFVWVACVTGYENNTDGSVTAIVEHADGSTSRETGTLLIGADGIHSSIRAQMHPDQPPIHWGGAIMWRGTTMAKPIRTGSSFVGLGTHKHRMVIYPISHPDPETGLAMINWIAEVTVDNSEGWKNSGWFKPVEIDDFIQHFEGWT